MARGSTPPQIDQKIEKIIENNLNLRPFAVNFLDWLKSYTKLSSAVAVTQLEPRKDPTSLANHRPS